MTAEFAWYPSEAFLTESHAAQFIRRHGLASYDAMVEKSANDPAWFWEAVALDFDVRFSKAYTKVLDESAGMPWARWFVGGATNIVDNVLDRHASGPAAERCAYIWEGEDGSVRRFTYREMAGHVNRAANALKSLGVGPGDRVAIYMPALPETIMAALATLKLGAVIVPLFSGFQGNALSARLLNAGATVVVTADGFHRRGRAMPVKTKLDEALADAPAVRSVLVVARTGETVPMQAGRDVRWDELVAAQSDVAETLAVDPNTPACISYTSGTTGTPKGAVLTHIGLMLMGIKEVRMQFDYKDGETFFWVTDWGWVVLPIWVMAGVGCAGGTSVIFEGAPDFPDAGRFWRMVDDYKVNIFGLAATAARIFRSKGDEYVKRYNLSSLRVLGSTGESWNEAPWRWFFDTVGGGRCPIINGSGGTEVTGCFVAPSVMKPLKPCSVGGPAPGLAAAVVDNNGTKIKEGVGYLVCKRPWPGMTQGVWGDVEKYLDSYWRRLPGIWFHGDWVEIDADGAWFVLGRADDTLKVSGRRISPAEIETVLVDDPSIAEAAAVGAPDEVRGEAIVCFVVLKAGVSKDATLVQRLSDRVADEMGPTLRPQAIHVVPDLPRTRSNKIVRRAIKSRFLGEPPAKDMSMIENPEALDGIPTRATT